MLKSFKINLNNQEKLHVTFHNSKKMEDFFSLSTDNRFNEFCIKNSKNEKFVCSKCYAKRDLNLKKNQECFYKNQKILTNRLLNNQELLIIKKTFEINLVKTIRFEAFGELNNYIHLVNYMNVCLKNPKIKFTLFTKRFPLICEYLNKNNNKLPKNLNLVLSSFFINQTLSNLIVEKIKKYHKNTISFSVYEKSIIKKQNIKYNCSKKCKTCRNCYKKDNLKNVIEELNL